MKIQQIIARFRTNEGEIKPNGVSWDRTAHSRIVIFLRLGKFIVRLRKPYVKTRFGWQLNFFRRPSRRICPGIKFEFDAASIQVNGVRVSLDLLDALTLPRPGVTYSFERRPIEGTKGYTVFITEYRKECA